MHTCSAAFVLEIRYPEICRRHFPSLKLCDCLEPAFISPLKGGCKVVLWRATRWKQLFVKIARVDPRTTDILLTYFLRILSLRSVLLMLFLHNIVPRLYCRPSMSPWTACAFVEFSNTRTEVGPTAQQIQVSILNTLPDLFTTGI